MDNPRRAAATEIECRDPIQTLSHVTEELVEREARWQTVALLRPVWHQRRVVGRITVWAIIASTIVAFLIPRQYESTAQLMPPDNPSAANFAMLSTVVGNTAGSAATGLASDLLGLKSSGALFVGVLNSRTVEDGVINRLDLRKVYWVGTYYKARKILRKRTDLSEDRKSGIVTITVRDGDPKRAAAITKVYVEELNRVLAQSSTSAARRERIFLEDRLRSVKRDLDEAQQRFSQFASAKSAIDMKDQARAMVEAAALLQGQTIAAQSQLRGLEQIYAPNNIRIRTLQARVAELNRQLEKIGGKDVGTLRENSDAVDPLYPSIRQLPLLGVTWADLFRQARIAEIIYETLTKQCELAKVQEAKEIPRAHLLDEPQVPERKSFPPRSIIVIVGTVLGLMFGAAWVVGKELWFQADRQDPLNIFVSEVSADLHASWQSGSLGKVRWRRITSRFRGQ